MLNAHLTRPGAYVVIKLYQNDISIKIFPFFKMHHLPKFIQYEILNYLSFADVYNYTLTNRKSSQLLCDQNFFKVMLMKNNEHLFQTKPDHVNWITWFKQSGTLICDNQIVAKNIKSVYIDNCYETTIIYIDRFDNLYIAGELLTTELKRAIPNNNGIVESPYKWLSNIRDAKIWNNSLLILTTQNELLTFGSDFSLDNSNPRLTLHATDVKSIGGRSYIGTTYLYYITNDGKLYGFFRNDKFNEIFDSDTSEDLIAINVQEAKVDPDATARIHGFYGVWYTNSDHQLFWSDLDTARLVLPDVKTFDVSNYGSIIAYIGLNGGVYIYQNSMSTLLLDGQYITVKLYDRELYVLDKDLNLWVKPLPEETVFEPKKIVVSTELKLVASNVLNFSLNYFNLCYVQL